MEILWKLPFRLRLPMVIRMKNKWVAGKNNNLWNCPRPRLPRAWCIRRTGYHMVSIYISLCNNFVSVWYKFPFANRIRVALIITTLKWQKLIISLNTHTHAHANSSSNNNKKCDDDNNYKSISNIFTICNRNKNTHTHTPQNPALHYASLRVCMCVVFATKYAILFFFALFVVRCDSFCSGFEASC